MNLKGTNQKFEEILKAQKALLESVEPESEEAKIIRESISQLEKAIKEESEKAKMRLFFNAVRLIRLLYNHIKDSAPDDFLDLF